MNFLPVSNIMSEGMTLNDFVVFVQAQLKLYVQRQVAAAMLEADTSSGEAPGQDNE